jgi:hypothetical protein
VVLRGFGFAWVLEGKLKRAALREWKREEEGVRELLLLLEILWMG